MFKVQPKGFKKCQIYRDTLTYIPGQEPSFNQLEALSVIRGVSGENKIRDTLCMTGKLPYEITSYIL